MAFQKGDFVVVTLETNEKYRGQIKDIENEEYIIEICVNKKKSEKNETEEVRVMESQIEPI